MRADILAFRDLKACSVQSVFYAGDLIQEAAFADPKALPVIGRNTINIPPLDEQDFCFTEPSGETPVIGTIESKIITNYLVGNIISVGGDKRPESARDLTRISVIERHGKNGNIGNGFVPGFSLKAVAIASTVCHAHHNIVCVGSNYLDMITAIDRLGKIQGGFLLYKMSAYRLSFPCK